MKKVVIFTIFSIYSLLGVSQSMQQVEEASTWEELIASIEQLPASEKFWKKSDSSGSMPLERILVLVVEVFGVEDEEGNNFRKVLQMAKTKGADLNAVDKKNQVSLFTRFMEENIEILSKEQISVLVEEGGDLMFRPKKKADALFDALAAKLEYDGEWIELDNMVHLLKESGIDLEVDQSNYFDLSLFHWAVFSENYYLVKAILECGVDVDKRTSNGKGGALDMALQPSLSSERTDIVELLLEAGANVNEPCRACDMEGYLHRAAYYDYRANLPLLLEYGGDVNMRDKKGETPLHWALEVGNGEMALALINAGADIEAVSDEGKSVRDAAYAASEKWADENLVMVLEMFEN